jgi:hypothetical protein
MLIMLRRFYFSGSMKSRELVLSRSRPGSGISGQTCARTRCQSYICLIPIIMLMDSGDCQNSHDPIAHKKAEVGRYVLEGKHPTPTWYT